MLCKFGVRRVYLDLNSSGTHKPSKCNAKDVKIHEELHHIKGNIKNKQTQSRRKRKDTCVLFEIKK